MGNGIPTHSSFFQNKLTSAGEVPRQHGGLRETRFGQIISSGFEFVEDLPRLTVAFALKQLEKREDLARSVVSLDQRLTSFDGLSDRLEQHRK